VAEFFEHPTRNKEHPVGSSLFLVGCSNYSI
jgi:hypothetical protein